MTSRTAVTVLTQDPELLDQLLAVATAAGVAVEVLADAGTARHHWDRRGVFVVGVDQAPALAILVSGRRPHVYLVGGPGTADELLRWSVPLRAVVVGLPDGAAELTRSLAQRTDSGAAGRLIAVIGGSGGVGTSTCAAAVAAAAARRDQRCALIDLDPVGGGLELLLGAEHDPGWRWPRLHRVRGFVGDLSAELVQLGGVDLLSVARDPGIPPPGVEQVQAVLASTSRSHRLTIVDLPRTVDPVTTDVADRCAALLVVVQLGVRGVAAAEQLVSRLPAVPMLGLLTRGRERGLLRAELVADRLGADLIFTLPEDEGLKSAAERGEPPGRSPKSRLGRAADQLLERVEEQLGPSTRSDDDQAPLREPAGTRAFGRSDQDGLRVRP